MLDDSVGIEVPHREFTGCSSAVPATGSPPCSGRCGTTLRGTATLAFQALRGNFAPSKTSRAEHRAIVDAFEAYDAPTAASWAATQVARTAIVVAREIDPDHPATRV